LINLKLKILLELTKLNRNILKVMQKFSLPNKS